MSGRVVLGSRGNNDNCVEVTGIGPLNPANARLLNITLTVSSRIMIFVEGGRVFILYQKENGTGNSHDIVAL